VPLVEFEHRSSRTVYERRPRRPGTPVSPENGGGGVTASGVDLVCQFANGVLGRTADDRPERVCEHQTSVVADIVRHIRRQKVRRERRERGLFIRHYLSPVGTRLSSLRVDWHIDR